MSEKHYFVCNECNKKMENCECHKDQLMFTLRANYDTSKDVGYHNPKGTDVVHFCGVECLKKYVNSKIEDHNDLPINEK